jgi:hypothetical protein
MTAMMTWDFHFYGCLEGLNRNPACLGLADIGKTHISVFFVFFEGECCLAVYLVTKTKGSGKRGTDCVAELGIGLGMFLVLAKYCHFCLP